MDAKRSRDDPGDRHFPPSCSEPPRSRRGGAAARGRPRRRREAARFKAGDKETVGGHRRRRWKGRSVDRRTARAMSGSVARTGRRLLWLMVAMAVLAGSATAIAGVRGVRWGLLLHNSFDPAYRSPGGPVIEGTVV